MYVEIYDDVEVYDRRWGGFYVCAHVEVSLYVYLYKKLEVYDMCEAGFCVCVCDEVWQILHPLTRERRPPHLRRLIHDEDEG